jgi:phytoene synthase
VTRRAASSFYYSFFLLPREQRLAMSALYAFLRKTDDLGDSYEPVAARRTALRQWQRQLKAAMEGVASDPILPALVDTTRHYRIPMQYLTDVIDGVEMDLAPQRFETFDDLQCYCHLVASAVGLACIHIWGFQDERAFEPARHCGVAFQLTNILRDLKEDAARGRIYLPQEDLRRFGYSQDDLANGIQDDRLRQLIDFEVERAERLYRAAGELNPYLAPRGRRVFGAMIATYHGLLNEIRRHRGDVLRGPVALTTWRKVTIAAAWALPASGRRRILPSPHVEFPCTETPGPATGRKEHPNKHA